MCCVFKVWSAKAAYNLKYLDKDSIYYIIISATRFSNIEISSIIILFLEANKFNVTVQIYAECVAIFCNLSLQRNSGNLINLTVYINNGFLIYTVRKAHYVFASAYNKLGVIYWIRISRSRNMCNNKCRTDTSFI